MIMCFFFFSYTEENSGCVKVVVLVSTANTHSIMCSQLRFIDVINRRKKKEKGQKQLVIISNNSKTKTHVVSAVNAT